MTARTLPGRTPPGLDFETSRANLEAFAALARHQQRLPQHYGAQLLLAAGAAD